MSLEWFGALKAVVERFGAIAEDMSALRSELRALAHAILEATSEPPPAAAATAPPETATPAQPESPVLPATEEQNQAPDPSPPVEAVAPFRPAPAPPDIVEPPPRIPSTPWLPTTDDELSLVEVRCRLKAEATRWSISRNQMLREGQPRAEIEARDHEIINKARELSDCFLWMIRASGISSANLALHGNLAGCFDTVAAAVALVRDILADDGGGDMFERGLNLLAEAQSALWTAVDAVEGQGDSDQRKVYDWLRNKAAQRHIYIPRFMRGEDRADPARWDQTLARIENLESQLVHNRRRDKQRHKLLNKIRYELKVATTATDKLPHWRTVAATIDALVKDGLPPSNRELRDLLLPFFEDIPELEEMPASFRMVLRETDRFLASIPTEFVAAPPREPAPEVKEAASLLQGRSAVLIGGSNRPKAKEALTTALGLKDLVWVEIDEYQSLDTFEPYIARPDVALVLLAIRWSRHSFGEVQQFCDRYGKPLVRLPAGYNPNQVAAQILAQCSDRLAGRRNGAG